MEEEEKKVEKIREYFAQLIGVLYSEMQKTLDESMEIVDNREMVSHTKMSLYARSMRRQIQELIRKEKMQ